MRKTFSDLAEHPAKTNSNLNIAIIKVQKNKYLQIYMHIYSCSYKKYCLYQQNFNCKKTCAYTSRNHITMFI